LAYNLAVEWVVEYTDEFEAWFDRLSSTEQESVAASLLLLRQTGPTLGYPHSSQIKGSRHGSMRELRIQHKGQPLRALYAFDPRRAAIMLLGGNKKGDDRWYRRFVPLADDLFDEHLRSL